MPPTIFGFTSVEFGANELDALSNRIANGLVAGGIEPGDRVTLFGPNCGEWLASYYGIVKTGAVVNPINVMLTPEEVGHRRPDSLARESQFCEFDDGSGGTARRRGGHQQGLGCQPHRSHHSVHR